MKRARSVQVLAVAVLSAGLVRCGGGAYLNPASPPMAYAAPGEAQPTDGEGYDAVRENRFVDVKASPLSTFGVDVDTASYSNVRRFLMNEHRLPVKDAVRVEEMINYFTYAYPEPTGGAPVSITTDVAACPWEPSHQLVRIGLQAKRIEEAKTPPRNLTFLLDVSGSMMPPERLPLVKQAMRLLVNRLNANDSVAIVVYAGQEGLALAPTRGDQKEKIFEALDKLEAGGSTNGGAGIRLAYKVARESFRKDGINRVILATDGDFNVGTTSMNELETLIDQEKKSGVFLTVLGVGTGNVKDNTMEHLADKGNGNYAYLDSLNEARKVLVAQAGSTLVTVAKDVKIQVAWNAQLVSTYRLIGYENRMLRAEDFKDDKKDAGDMGAGHSVTALYEIVPPAAHPTPASGAAPGELMTVKLRYKQPDGDASKELVQVVPAPAAIGPGAPDTRFASAVAAFGMLLRKEEHKGKATLAMVQRLGQEARGEDKDGYRTEFLRLVAEADKISGPALSVAR